MDTGVLVVDDARQIRTMLREVLRSDFEVVGEATNGEEAVRLYDETDPDVVLMDILMESSDGLAATEEIRRRDPNARIVMVTSIRESETRTEAFDRGAADYVTKPFDPDELRETVREHANDAAG